MQILDSFLLDQYVQFVLDKVLVVGSGTSVLIMGQVTNLSGFGHHGIATKLPVSSELPEEEREMKP